MSPGNITNTSKFTACSCSSLDLIAGEKLLWKPAVLMPITTSVSLHSQRGWNDFFPCAVAKWVNRCEKHCRNLYLWWFYGCHKHNSFDCRHYSDWRWNEAEMSQKTSISQARTQIIPRVDPGQVLGVAVSEKTQHHGHSTSTNWASPLYQAPSTPWNPEVERVGEDPGPKARSPIMNCLGFTINKNFLLLDFFTKLKNICVWDDYED